MAFFSSSLFDVSMDSNRLNFKIDRIVITKIVGPKVNVYVVCLDKRINLPNDELIHTLTQKKTKQIYHSFLLDCDINKKWETT
jgi:hypothetical protein